MFETCQKPCMPLHHVEDYSVIICLTVHCECTQILCIVSKTEPNPPDPKRLMTLTSLRSTFDRLWVLIFASVH